MKRLTSLTLLLLLSSIGADRASAQAQLADCGVTITSPANLSKADATVLVGGKAKVRPQTYVWVFAHRQGVGLWWPQGGAAASVRDGIYNVLVSLGGPQDVGAQFEIQAAVFDAAENTKLDRWFRDAEKSGSYPGMPWPPTVQGCGPPARLVVTKTR